MSIAANSMHSSASTEMKIFCRQRFWKCFDDRDFLKGVDPWKNACLQLVTTQHTHFIMFAAIWKMIILFVVFGTPATTLSLFLGLGSGCGNGYDTRNSDSENFATIVLIYGKCNKKFSRSLNYVTMQQCHSYKVLCLLNSETVKNYHADNVP